MDNKINMKSNDMKGIAIISICIMTILAAISGASYAFFQVNKVNDTDVKGTSSYNEDFLSLNIAHSTRDTVGDKKLFPLLDTDVTTSANATNKCVDESGSALCKQFAITVTNNSAGTIYLDGAMSLVANNMPNLKWSLCSDTNVCDSATYYTKSDTSLGEVFALSGKTSKTINIVIWISETGSAQTDSGEFNGTVTFNAYTDGGKQITGITSTIRS